MSQSTDYGELMKSSFEDYKDTSNMIPLVVGFLIMGIGTAFSGGLLAGPLYMGFTAMLLKVTRGEAVEVGDIGFGFKHFVPSLILSLLFGVAMMLGMIALVIGAVIAAFLLCASMHFLADNPEMGAVDAMKASVDLVKSNPVDFLVVMVVGSVLTSLVSGVTFGLGTLIMGPYAALLQTRLYHQLNAGAPSAL